MAKIPRFPQLALPFAIVGALAAWLSAGLVSPWFIGALADARSHYAVPTSVLVFLFQAHTALCGLVAAAAAGALVTRWCRGKRYAYELDAPSSDIRPPTDSAPLHALAVISAGAITGMFVKLQDVGALRPKDLVAGAVVGGLLAMVFVPIFIAVIAASRRVSQARVGSLVAGSYRRAVWGILAMTLSVATLLSLADVPASSGQEHGARAAPIEALLVLGAGVVVLAMLVADGLALHRARRALTQEFSPMDPMLMDTVDEIVPCLDLGLGDDIQVHLARSAAVYRTRDHALNVVWGSPKRALVELRRAIGRYMLGLVVMAAVFGAHWVAASDIGLRFYAEQRCGAGNLLVCALRL